MKKRNFFPSARRVERRLAAQAVKALKRPVTDGEFRKWVAEAFNDVLDASGRDYWQAIAGMVRK